MKQPSQSRSGGRPSLLEAEKLAEKIVDVARELFFANGYERTSIEQIASTAHVAKRTVYSRFAGKTEIFEAVVKSYIDRNFMVLEHLDIEGLSLREKLDKVAEALLRHVISADLLAIDRALAGEAHNFPGLAKLHEEHASLRFVGYVADILMADTQNYSGSPEKAANHASIFLILVVLPIMRSSMFKTLGNPDFDQEIAQVRLRLDFFMRGIAAPS